MSEEIVKIPTFPYDSIYGALGLQTSPSKIEWERCRDRFQSKTEADGIKSFLFYHKNGVADNVIDFMRTFEQACQVPHDQDLVIKKTTHKNVLWIGMSDWWRYRVRRSLLTALLRCGQNFVHKNGQGFVEALNSEYYLAGTKEALEYFMEGHTACKINKSDSTSFPGWYTFFYQKSKKQVESCLVRLKKKQQAEEK